MEKEAKRIFQAQSNLGISYYIVNAEGKVYHSRTKQIDDSAKEVGNDDPVSILEKGVSLGYYVEIK